MAGWGAPWGGSEAHLCEVRDAHSDGITVHLSPLVRGHVLQPLLHCVCQVIYRSAIVCMIARASEHDGRENSPVAYDRQTANQPAVVTAGSPQRLLRSLAILNPHLISGCARLRSAIAAFDDVAIDVTHHSPSHPLKQSTWCRRSEPCAGPSPGSAKASKCNAANRLAPNGCVDAMAWTLRMIDTVEPWLRDTLLGLVLGWVSAEGTPSITPYAIALRAVTGHLISGCAAGISRRACSKAGLTHPLVAKLRQCSAGLPVVSVTTCGSRALPMAVAMQTRVRCWHFRIGYRGFIWIFCFSARRIAHLTLAAVLLDGDMQFMAEGACSGCRRQGALWQPQ